MVLDEGNKKKIAREDEFFPLNKNRILRVHTREGEVIFRSHDGGYGNKKN